MVQVIRGIEESSFYQLLVEKGLNEGIEKGLQKGMQQGPIAEAHPVVLRLGTAKFGTPSPETITKINSLDELKVLHELELRILKATRWQELLGDR
jgi:predicted transposase YdaD